MIAALSVAGLRSLDLPTISVERHLETGIEFGRAPVLAFEGAGVFPGELGRLLRCLRVNHGHIVGVGVDPTEDFEAARENWQCGGREESSAIAAERPARLLATNQIAPHFQIRFKSLGRILA